MSIKSARGRNVDMKALAAKNENTRAISNMPINARGDIIDNRGEVTMPRETIAKEFYKNHVPGSDEKTIGIKEDTNIVNTIADKIVDKPVAKPAEQPAEIARHERERDNGSKYFEVEYSDGSIEEINIPKSKK